MKEYIQNFALIVIELVFIGLVVFNIQPDCLAQSSTASSKADETVLQKKRLLQDIDHTKQTLLVKLKNYNRVEKNIGLL